MGCRGEYTGQHRPHQFIAAGKLPQAAVKPHHRKQDNGHNGKAGALRSQPSR